MCFTVGFWCQRIAENFFKIFGTCFDTKMMAKVIQTKRLVRPGQLSGTSTLKGLVGFENNFNGTTFHHHLCTKTGVKCPKEFLRYSLALETYSQWYVKICLQMGMGMGWTFLDTDTRSFIFSITYNFQINKAKKMLHTNSFPFD